MSARFESCLLASSQFSERFSALIKFLLIVLSISSMCTEVQPYMTFPLCFQLGCTQRDEQDQTGLDRSTSWSVPRGQGVGLQSPRPGGQVVGLQLLNTIEHNWQLFKTINHYWTPLNTFEHYWRLPNTIEHYWTLLDWAIMSCAGLYWAVLGCTWLY